MTAHTTTHVTTRCGGFARSAAVAVAMVVALAALGGCGLPDEAEPRIVDPAEVPFDLAGAAQLDAPSYENQSDLRPITVYLVSTLVTGEKQLVPVERLIPDPVNLSTVLGNLMAGGVTPAERERELINQVPGAELLSVERADVNAPADQVVSDTTTTTRDPADRVSGPTATVEVNAEFFDRFPTPEAQRLAIGQIVLTITAYKPASGEPSVDRVRFTVNDRIRYVPTGDPRTPTLNFVGATHYAQLKGTAADVEVPVPAQAVLDTTTTTAPAG